MKKVIGVMSAVVALGASAHAIELKNDTDKFSYIIAQNMGESMKRQGIALNADVFVASLKSVLAGEQSQMTPQEMQTFMMSFQQKFMAQMQAKREAEGKKNIEEGKKYLESNKTKEGFKVTKSGLQYKVIKQGNGPRPTLADQVKAHYVGTLIDGTEFDSSVRRGEPSVFPLSEVIPGWKEALPMMTVGSKWEIVVPSELAYGANPRPGGLITPHAVLKFEIELLGIEAGAAAPQGAAQK